MLLRLSIRQKPPPLLLHQVPTAPWHLFNSQLALPMSLRLPVPTTLAESCPGSLPCVPLVLALVLGTRGCL